jgi:membrane protease YdiL (CAAX protease family)
VPVAWYLLALGIPLVVIASVLALGGISGTPAGSLLAGVSPRALIIGLVVLAPAFAEELGWRGLGVTRLVSSLPPLPVALVLGALWAVTHLPLFLAGQPYHGLALWPMPLMILGYSVFLTWLYLGSGGSVPVVTIAHATMNALTPWTSGIATAREWQLRGLVFALVAVGLAVLTRGRLGAQRPVDGVPVSVPVAG